MPFVTKNPSAYISVLSKDSTDPLQIGLYWGGSINDVQGRAMVELAAAIHKTRRSIRCLWLRFNDGDETVLAVLNLFGRELIGTTAIESIVLEDKIGRAELRCLKDFLAENNNLRGIKFMRTNLDASCFKLLRVFFARNSALKVLDISANPKVGDESIKEILSAILRGEAQLETLNIGESNSERGNRDDSVGISNDGIQTIAEFVAKTPSLSTLRIRLRDLSDIGIEQLAAVIGKTHCRISRLDLGGRFGDIGLKKLGDALKINRSVKSITIGFSQYLTNAGGQAIVEAVEDMKSWDSVKKSNNTLQNVYISEKVSSNMSKNLIAKLQSITTVGPHQTLQTKVWNYMRRNIEDISYTGVKLKHMPHVISFVDKRGHLDSIFRLVRSWNVPLLFANPTPERVRLTSQMEKVERENRLLKEMLLIERRRNESLRQENERLREASEVPEPKTLRLCCFSPVFKMIEACKNFRIEVVR